MNSRELVHVKSSFMLYVGHDNTDNIVIGEGGANTEEGFCVLKRDVDDDEATRTA